MDKKVLIISGSPRKDGNSDILCSRFMQGAEEAGNTVEKVFLHDLKIGHCMACYGCRKTKKCVQKDDMEALKGFTDCLPEAIVREEIYGEGVYQKGEVEKTAAYKKAYVTGKMI